MDTLTKPEFVERESCISCMGKSLKAVWRSQWNYHRADLEQDGYSGNPVALLCNNYGGERIHRVKCEDCGAQFHKFILSNHWLKVLYSEWINDAQIERYEQSVARDKCDVGIQRIKHCLRIQALLNRGSIRLLDFGCGDGEFLQVAKILGFDAVGIDFSSSRESRAARTGLQIAGSLDDVEANFDCVTMFELLEHVSEPLELLNTIHGRMRPEGVLLIEVPDCSGISVPKNRDQFHRVHPLEHINNFTPRSLRDMCKRAGFEPLPRVPAHVTTSLKQLLVTEASRFVDRPRTSAYFRKV